MIESQRLTDHEMLQINELLRLESTGIQKAESMLPLVSDGRMKQEIQACMQMGRSHINALMSMIGSPQQM